MLTLICNLPFKQIFDQAKHSKFLSVIKKISRSFALGSIILEWPYFSFTVAMAMKFPNLLEHVIMQNRSIPT